MLIPDCASIVNSVDNVEMIRDLLISYNKQIILIPQLPLKETGFSGLVNILLDEKPFMWDFNGKDSHPVIPLLQKLKTLQNLDTHLYSEIDRMADTLGNFVNKMLSVNPGSYAMLSLRNFFCPGDMILHTDELPEGEAMRFLWPLGRNAGMKFTPRSNVNINKYRYFINRELHLIRLMDSRVYFENSSLSEIWLHRPKQVQAMMEGKHAYMIDPALIFEVPNSWSSIHWIETVKKQGTFHCNTAANMNAPGLQIMITTIKTHDL